MSGRNTSLITYLLTPRCRVLLEKLTGLQLVKKFPAFYGTRRFITALTNVRPLSLSWASPIQSTYPHPTSWRSILILSTHLFLGLPSGLYPSGFPTKTLYAPFSSPIRATLTLYCIENLLRIHYKVRFAGCKQPAKRTPPKTSSTKSSNTQRTENKTTHVVIQQHSCTLLMMDILMSETCWARKKWNKTASDIKLVFHSSTITMMHGPINIRLAKFLIMLHRTFMHKRPLLHEDLGLNHPPISVLCFTLNRIFIIKRKRKQKEIINNYHPRLVLFLFPLFIARF